MFFSIDKNFVETSWIYLFIFIMFLLIKINVFVLQKFISAEVNF